MKPEIKTLVESLKKQIDAVVSNQRAFSRQDVLDLCDEVGGHVEPISEAIREEIEAEEAAMGDDE